MIFSILADNRSTGSAAVFRMNLLLIALFPNVGLKVTLFDLKSALL